MPFWYYYAGTTPQGYGLGSDVLMEVTAGPTNEISQDEQMPIEGGFVLQRFGVFDHEPTGDEKFDLLPRHWQEEYADTRFDDDLDDDLDDEDWDEDPEAGDVDEPPGEAGRAVVG